MRKKVDWLQILTVFTTIVLTVGIILAAIFTRPEIIKDYGHFAIVKWHGEIYIWNKDFYGEGMYPYKGEEVWDAESEILDGNND